MNGYILSSLLVLQITVTLTVGAIVKRNVITSDCHHRLLHMEKRLEQGSFIIDLQDSIGLYPEYIRVSVDEVYDGAYKVSAITPGGRILSEATFATKGEMNFDPRFEVAKIRVKYEREMTSENVDNLPRIRISVFGCYGPHLVSATG